MKAVFCIGLLFLASMISSCGGGSGSQTQSQPSVSALLISPGSASINSGGVQQFFATAELSDGSSKDMTNTVQWSSADTTIASINTSGLASGSASGSVTVTAKTGTIHATATLKVSGTAGGATLQSITLSPAASSMPVNTSQQFTATGKYSDGRRRGR